MAPRRWLAPAIYAALALLVAGPLLAPGYVFALDHAMGPQSVSYYATYLGHNEDPIQNKGGFALLLAGLDALLPMWIAQKVLLFTPFLLAGLGAHALARRHASERAAYLGGLLYALSPFVYLRGVSGQVGVLWAYGLAPWFLLAWLAYVETRTRRALLAAVLLVTLTAVFQAHGAALLALLVTVHTGVRILRKPREALATLRAPLGLAAWSVVVNAAWLVPVALASRTTLTSIGEADRAFFATTSAGLPSVGLAALTLQGFWRDAYASPYSPAFLLIIPGIVLLLSSRGLYARRDDATLTLAAAGTVALVLAIGTSSTFTGWLFQLAWDHVPGMRGFRDAHKLLALVALAYAGLAPIGLDALVASLRATRLRALAPVAVALVLALPLAGATPLLLGYDGQLQTTQYPDGWVEAENATQGCEGAMLVLPWHLYLDLGFVPQPERRVTGPAKLFFSCPTLTSDNLELGDAASQASTPSIEYADHWMTHARVGSGNPRNITTLGNLFSPIGVEYVLLLKESDWRTLAPILDAQRDLRVVLDNEDVRLYENLAPTARAWRTDRVVPISSWDDLVPLSERAPLAGIAFPMREEAPAREGDAAPSGTGSGGRYLLASPPPRTPTTSWRLEGSAPAFLSLGFAPVFDDPRDGAPKDSRILLVAAPAWALSGISLGSLVVWSSRMLLDFISRWTWRGGLSR